MENRNIGQGDCSAAPLISIIIPVYNILDCLERCVDSCCSQSYKNLEILLVDDGSTDGTGELCDRLREKDGRIRVYHKENGGTSSARNLGIEKARGEFLGFVDSDDFISEDMYQLMIEAIRKHQVDIAQVSRDEIDPEGRKLPDICIPPQKPYFCKSDEFLRQLLLHRGDASFCTKLIKKKLFEGERFPEGRLNEDFYLLLKILKNTEGIYILPKQCYHVFYRMGSNTRKKDKNDFSRVFMDIVDNADMAERLVEECYHDLRPVAVRFALIQRLDYLLHIPIVQMKKENEFYQRVKRYLKKHLGDILKNPYLTRKNRSYLLLLALAPGLVRRLHQWYRRR